MGWGGHKLVSTQGLDVGMQTLRNEANQIVRLPGQGSSEGEYGQMASSAWTLHPCGRKGREGRAPGLHHGHALSQAQPESWEETARPGGEGGQGQERWDTSRKGLCKENLEAGGLWLLWTRKKLRQRAACMAPGIFSPAE